MGIWERWDVGNMDDCLLSDVTPGSTASYLLFLLPPSLFNMSVLSYGTHRLRLDKIAKLGRLDSKP